MKRRIIERIYRENYRENRENYFEEEVKELGNSSDVPGKITEMIFPGESSIKNSQI